MKSNFLRVSYFAIAAAGLMAACTQENVNSDVAASGDVVSISVSRSAFAPVDADSRAATSIDGQKTTSFAEDDQLGLFVVSKADGSFRYENVPFTYKGSEWTSGAAIYYYKNSDYIVYYPYDETLEVGPGADVEETIKTTFTNKENFYTQGDADAYEAVDLMMAKVENPESGEMTFNLAHKFSMIEISVPVRKYITEKTYGDSNEKFEYNAPVKLEWATALKYGENEVTPYAAGKGVYRFIVQPGSDVAVNIDGSVTYEEAPYNFDNKDNAPTLSLAEGNFKHYKVTISGLEISDAPKERDLEVGDYYYSDGSIYPYGDQQGDNDLSNPMKEGCIGVVFDTKIGAQGTEWLHGTILALDDKKNSENNYAKYKWADYNGQVSTFYPASNKDEREALLNQYNGYELTYSEAFKDIRIVKEVLNFGIYAGTDNSGWYVPTAGQFALLMSNVSGYVFDTENNVTGENSINNSYTTPIKEALRKVDGVFQEGVSGGYRWWTITESDANNAYTLTLDKTGLFTRGKTSTWHVRPVLSF